MRPASYALFLIVDIGHNSKFGHDYSKLPTPNIFTAYTAAGEASMDLIERGFAVTALTSFFVLLGAIAWLWAT